ncbi:hypothetical protein [Azospirillum sp.]|uniref:hypothetical protein n=1 Tax=Azospirillum sp. TaxID=34012 RepID=UPI003D7302DB
MTNLRPTPVVAFVDWNSQIHNANPPKGVPTFVAEQTLNHVGKIIGRALRHISVEARFSVNLRIYHGWHKGFEPTENRRALITASAGTNFSLLSTNSNVIIRPDISFGDRLISALDTRLHTRLGVHLPDTLRPVSRRARRKDALEEKMVDTAMASDIVDLAHRDSDSWILIMGEDDDLVPPLYTIEAIRGNRHRRVLLIRKRAAGPFLKLDDFQVYK